ncbi:MAG: hypothetical protein JJT89_03690 [Nitriliruptoraceae bacterium]|nr:hypothetical protein [Nitriliruptoraceae bacterium]
MASTDGGAGTTPPDGPDDLEVDLEGLAERLQTDDLSLGILTDEELLAVGLLPHPDGPGPWFAGLDEVGREIARTAALRSLVARGLLRPSDEPGALDVHPSLELLRHCREEPVGRCLITRTMGEHVDRALIHLVGDGIVLEELIDGQGLHACTLRDPARLVHNLALRCDPEAVAGEETGTVWTTGGPGTPSAPAQDGTTAVTHVDAARFEARVEELLAAAVVRTDLQTVRQVDGVEVVHAALTVLATPDGLWAVSSGRPVPPDAETDATATDAASEDPIGALAELGASELPAALLGVVDPLVEMAEPDRPADAGPPTAELEP